MTQRIRDVAEPLRAALQEVHRRVVCRRPWSEVAAALDVAAGLREAREPDAAELVALERLEALARAADASDDEDVERVLQATETARTGMPPEDAAWLLERAVERRPALAARYGAPSRAVVAITSEGGKRIPAEVAEAIRYSHALRRMGWDHEEVLAVLDETETMPVASEYLGVLAFDRIMVGHMYELPEDFMEEAIQRVILSHAEHPAWLLAGAIVTAAGRHPALARKYLPGVIAASEAELKARPDVEGQANLESARRALASAMAGPEQPAEDE